MERGAWLATVRSVELKQLSMTRHLSIRRVWVSNGLVDLGEFRLAVSIRDMA